MDIPGIRCLTCIHIKVCSLKPTLLMYEMMAKEMAISLCPNFDRQVYFGAIHIEVICKCLDNILFV